MPGKCPLLYDTSSLPREFLEYLYQCISTMKVTTVITVLGLLGFVRGFTPLDSRCSSVLIRGSRRFERQSLRVAATEVAATEEAEDEVTEAASEEVAVASTIDVEVSGLEEYLISWGIKDDPRVSTCRGE